MDREDRHAKGSMANPQLILKASKYKKEFKTASTSEETDLKNEKVLLSNLKKAFFKIDVDGSGQISPEELREALMKLGEDITDDEIEQMVKAADTNIDG